MNYPDEWEMKELKQVGEWYTGSTPRRSNSEYWGGSIFWVSPKDMKTNRITDTGDKMTERALEETNSKVFPEDSIIMVTRSGILEHSFPVAVNEEPVAINQDLKCFVPSDSILTEFLYYYLVANENEILRECSKDGTTVASINSDSLYSYEVPVPPVEVQERIVNKIKKLFSQLDAGSKELDEAFERLDNYRQSVLNAGVVGNLTGFWRNSTDDIESGSELLDRILETRREAWDEKFQEIFKYRGKDYEVPEGPEVEELFDLPDCWTWTSINQLGYAIGGLTKNQDKRSSYSHEVPYLRVANVYANELKLDEIKNIRINDREQKTKILDKGDLLIVEGNGSKDQIGRVALWDGSIEPCSHQNHLIRIKILEEQLRKFVLYWLLSVRGRSYITEVASSTSGLYTLSLSKVRRIPIPLPPLEEAQQIVKEIEQRLSVQKQVRESLEKEMDRAEMLNQSVLKSAFEGKLGRNETQSKMYQDNKVQKDESQRRQMKLQEIEGDTHE